MNLKGFKKIHEDDKKAILQNQRGHQITLAKAQLSKSHLDGIGRLPLYKAFGDEIQEPNATSSQTGQPTWFASGMDPQQQVQAPALSPIQQSYNQEILATTRDRSAMFGPNGERPQNFDESAYDRANAELRRVEAGAEAARQQREKRSFELNTKRQALGLSPTAQAQDPSLAPQQEKAPEEPYPASEMTQEEPLQSETQPSPAQPFPAAGKKQPKPLEPWEIERQQAKLQYEKDHAKELGEQDALWEQDLNNGHITPQTYQSLFAKQDTLGKIGTIFGLMLSGAGSGLTHQPNAALEMMNQIIKNDLEAQKQSKTNAVNYLRVNSENELRKTQQLYYGAQTYETLLEAELKKQTHTLNQMGITALHDAQVNIVNPMAPGPLKTMAQATLNGVKNAAAADRALRNQQTNRAIRNAAGSRLSQQQYEKTTEALDIAGLATPAFAQRAKDRRNRYIPGVGYSNKDIPQESLERIKGIKQFNDLLDEYERLGNKMGWRNKTGVLTPSEENRSKSIRNDLITSYNDVKGLARFTSNEEDLYKGVIPDLGKINLTGSQVDLIKRLRASINQKLEREKDFAGIIPFSDSQGTQQQQQQFREGQRGTVNGKPAIIRNGKPVLLKN